MCCYKKISNNAIWIIFEYQYIPHPFIPQQAVNEWYYLFFLMKDHHNFDTFLAYVIT